MDTGRMGAHLATNLAPIVVLQQQNSTKWILFEEAGLNIVGEMDGLVWYEGKAWLQLT